MNMKLKLRTILIATAVVIIVLWLYIQYALDGFRHSLISTSGYDSIRSRLDKMIPICSSDRIGKNSTADFTSHGIYNEIRLEIDARSNGKYVVSFPSNDKFHRPLPSQTDRLYVFVLPHSHNDPGWLETFEDYYTYRSKSILTNMVNKLVQYPELKYIWAETVFLARWWEDQTEAVKQQLRELVFDERLEIVSGGWVMPDEAATHYYSIIDQLIEGNQWVTKNIGIKPANTWSIDPFGHSASAALIWKLSGFQNMVIQRVHQGVKLHLGHYQKLQFLWRQNWDTAGKHDILTHTDPYILYFVSDTCGPDSRICNWFNFKFAAAVVSGNEGRYGNDLYDQLAKKAKNYNFNVILMPVGGDFHGDTPSEWDRQATSFSTIFEYMNANKSMNIEIRFGNLKDYFRKLSEQETIFHLRGNQSEVKRKSLFPTFSGDFYNYSERDHEYWSGYYTSRPRSKLLSRNLQNFLKATDILHVLAIHQIQPSRSQDFKQLEDDLQQARRELALFQHHDAITGTNKPHVAEDYERRMNRAFRHVCNMAVAAAASVFIEGEPVEPLTTPCIPDAYDKVLQESATLVAESGSTLLLFNPHAHERRDYFTYRTVNNAIAILKGSDSTAEEVLFQISPVWKTTTNTLRKDIYEITFFIVLPPWGTASFYISRQPSAKHMATISYAHRMDLQSPDSPFTHQLLKSSQFIEIENQCMVLRFSSSSGMLTEIMKKGINQWITINLDFVRYSSYHSGPYLFDPKGPAHSVMHQTVNVSTVTGSVLSFVNVNHPYFKHRVYLYHTEQSTDAMCSMIKIENIATLNKFSDIELVMRFETSLKSGNRFFVDSNSLQMIERKLLDNFPLSANFYPMTSMAFIQDNDYRFTLHSNLPQSVSSLQTGSLETILDRTMTTDDTKGVGEGLTNNVDAPSEFRLTLEKISNNIESKPTSEHTSNRIVNKFPTLFSYHINDMLQNPVIPFWLGNKDSMKTPLILNTNVGSPMISTLQSDIEIVSFRSLIIQDQLNKDKRGTAMILHKRIYECHDTSAKMDDVFATPAFRFGEVSNIKEFTLSYLHQLRDNVTLRHIFNTLDPMDLKAYFIS